MENNLQEDKKMKTYISILKRFYDKNIPTSNVVVDGMIITPFFRIYSKKLKDGAVDEKKPVDVDKTVYGEEVVLYPEVELEVSSSLANKLVDMFKNIGKYTFAYNKGKVTLETGLAFLTDGYEMTLQGHCRMLGDLEFSVYSNWLRNAIELCNCYGTTGVRFESGRTAKGFTYLKVSSIGNSEYVILGERAHRLMYQ